MNPKDLVSEFVKMDDKQLLIIASYFVGCFAAVMAGRERRDVEAVCCSFLQELHEVTNGITPLPPKRPGH